MTQKYVRPWVHMQSALISLLYKVSPQKNVDEKIRSVLLGTLKLSGEKIRSQYKLCCEQLYSPCKSQLFYTWKEGTKGGSKEERK